jgi:tricarballylate dehydrogenase
VLEKTPEAEAGGNSFYTAGAFRFAHRGLEDLRPLVADDARLPETMVPPYPEADFLADLYRVTAGKCDETLARVLVGDSAETVAWLARAGIPWRLLYERQAYRSGGQWVFSGGIAAGTSGGGKGLIAAHTAAAARAGVRVVYRAAVSNLLRERDGAVAGVVYRDSAGAEHSIAAGEVVLAAGGFEASPGLRARHLGPAWEKALVRGSPANTGEVLELAISHGAGHYGDWRSCHSVAWDAGASPEGGDRELTNQRTRQSYPLGIVVNTRGERFLDEGADFRNYTYARYGREILAQPGGHAVQLFDARTRPLLRTEEYDSHPITVAQADTLDKLAEQLGIDPAGLAETVAAFNHSIDESASFDPAVKDGRAAHTDPPKSNWALALNTPPYYGYPVACGITFTFGGLHIDTHARVLDPHQRPIPGLYAAGELVGGLFSGNYPGGSGLTAGAVFGRRAGTHATDSRVE